MKHTLRISAILGAAALILCIGTSASAGMKEKEQNVNTQENAQLLLRDIYFAGGCFWGVEEYFSRIPGVEETTVGYANGTPEKPDYEAVSVGRQGTPKPCTYATAPGR